MPARAVRQEPDQKREGSRPSRPAAAAPRIPVGNAATPRLVAARRAGNNALSRAALQLRQADRRIIARALTIGTTTYQGDDYQSVHGFTTDLGHKLAARGYGAPKRLERIVQAALGRALNLKADESLAAKDIQAITYTSMDHFIDVLAERQYVAAKLPSGKPSRHRPKTLGKRPGWIAAINTLRPPTAQPQAARHVIPSHYLGWAVEQWNTTVPEIETWLTQAEKVNATLVQSVGWPAHKSLTAMKRTVWQILHNNPGNLWFGPSPANTVIGFLAPYFEDLLDHMRELDEADQLTAQAAKDLIAKLPQALGKSELSSGWNEIVGTAGAIGSSGDPLGDAEDWFDQLELDPRVLAEWHEAVEWKEALAHVDSSGKTFLTFLGKRFTGAIELK